jgi:hypothetical protein
MLPKSGDIGAGHQARRKLARRSAPGDMAALDDVMAVSDFDQRSTFLSMTAR